MCRRSIHLAGLLLTIVFLAAGCGKKSDSGPVVIDFGGDKENQPEATIDSAAMDLKHNLVDRRAKGIRNIVQHEAAAIPKLVELLSDKSFTVNALNLGQPNSTREAVIIALLKLGQEGERAAVDKGIPVLTAALQDTNTGVREHAIMAIALIGPKAPTAIDPLAKACGDTAENVRRAAYDALQRIGNVPATAYTPLLKNADPVITYDAAKTINGIRPLPKEILPALIEALKKSPAEMEPDEAALTRMEVAEAIASYGKDAASAVPTLIDVLKTTKEKEFDKFFRPRPGSGANAYRSDESPAMMALRKIGKPAVVDLQLLLSDESSFVRWQASAVLAGMGPEAAEAAVTLQMTFDKEFEREPPNLAVISTCGLAIVQLGAEHAPIVLKISEALASESEALRYYILRILARFGRKGEAAVMAIVPLLDDPEEFIREQAARTLGAFGPAAKGAMEALGNKLAEEKLEIRRHAVSALKAMGPYAADAAPALAQLLSDTDEAFRRDVLETLIAIGPGAKAAVPDLTRLIKATDPRERLLAMEALRVIGPDAQPAVAELVPALEDRDVEIRVAAAKALGAIGVGSPEVVKALAGHLKDSLMQMRVASARALAQLGPKAKSATDALKFFGGFERKGGADPVANVWAAVALYKIGIDADANLKIFVAALTNKSVRSSRLAAMDGADLLGASVKSVVPDLIAALADNTAISSYDPTPVRQRAALALGKMGPAAKEAVPKLTALLKENNELLKTTVLESLGQIGPEAEFALARLREVARTEPLWAEKAQAAIDKIETK